MHSVRDHAPTVPTFDVFDEGEYVCCEEFVGGEGKVDPNAGVAEGGADSVCEVILVGGGGGGGDCGGGGDGDGEDAALAGVKLTVGFGGLG